MATYQVQPGSSRDPDHPSYSDPEDSTLLATTGAIVVAFALGVGIVLATKLGDFWAQDASIRAVDNIRAGQIGAIEAWNPIVAWAGLALVMAGAVMALLLVARNLKSRSRARVNSLPGLVRANERSYR